MTRQARARPQRLRVLVGELVQRIQAQLRTRYPSGNTCPRDGTATTLMPAARAARTPVAESSKAMHSCGGTPSSRAACR